MLSPLDLWKDPSSVAALLDDWRQTPIKQQKQTLPNKQGGVGRQQQRSPGVYGVMAWRAEEKQPKQIK